MRALVQGLAGVPDGYRRAVSRSSGFVFLPLPQAHGALRRVRRRAVSTSWVLARFRADANHL